MSTPTDPSNVPLPVAGAERRERRDAALNRERILTAARELFAERGIASVSMDDVAERARVGKGTLYRRFGDRSGLALALLDERERAFQAAFMHGDPPLGPGAVARERLVAFFAALAAHVEARAELIHEAERGAPGARFRGPVYAVYHAHVAMLLREVDGGLDDAYLAHVLLSPFAAEVYLHLRDREGIGRDRVVAGLASVVDLLSRAGG